MIRPIDPKEVVLLNAEALPRLIDRLLKVEAKLLGIPAQNVHQSPNIYENEGGIDTYINGVPGVGNEWIPAGDSIWQYKSGDCSPSEIRLEVAKSEVQTALKKGAAYCLCLGNTLTTITRRNRLQALEESVHSINSQSEYRLHDAANIAERVSEHPALLRQEPFNLPLGDLVDFNGWQNQLVNVEIGFESDESRQELIIKLRQLLDGKTSERLPHIVGAVGIGKTRLVFEALNEEGLREQVLYAQVPEAISKGLMGWLVDSDVRLVLVVDQCSSREAKKYLPLSEQTDGRVRAITIGATSEGLDTNILNPVRVGPLPPDSITSIIEHVEPALEWETIQWILHQAEGYPSMAIALAEGISRLGTGIGAIELAHDSRVISTLKFQILFPEHLDHRVMQLMALMKQVGWEEGVSGEGEQLINHFGLNPSETRLRVRDLERRGLIGRKGRFRHVKPHILAVALAGEVWQAQADKILNTLLPQLSNEAQVKLVSRVGDLGPSSVISRYVGRYLSKNFFHSDDLHRSSELFFNLTQAAPDYGLSVLLDLLGSTSTETLNAFCDNYWITSALRLLAWQERTFPEASRLLFKLAAAHSGQSNCAASRIWGELFLPLLGATETPVLHRLAVVREALDSQSSQERLQGALAIESALSSHEMRGGGIEIYGGQLVNPRGYPPTIGENREYRKEAVKLLGLILEDSVSEVGIKARAVLCSSLSILLQYKLDDEVLSLVEHVDMDALGWRRSAFEALDRLLEFEKENINTDTVQRIQELQHALVQSSFSARFHRWVGAWNQHRLFREQERGESMLRSALEELADESLAEPEYLYSELPFLASSEATYAPYFCLILGEKDVESIWLEPLVELAANNRVYGAYPLGYYVKGRASTVGSEWRDTLLDKWIDTRPELFNAAAVTIASSIPSSSDAKRIVQLIDNNISMEELSPVIWWAPGLSIQDLKPILTKISEQEDATGTRISLFILRRWLEDHPEEKAQLADLALNLIQQTETLENEIRFHWEAIATQYAESHPARMVAIVVNLLTSEETRYRRKRWVAKILAQAILSDPDACWPIVREKLAELPFSFFMPIETLGAAILPFGIERTFNWAEEHPQGPYTLALLAPLSLDLNDFTHELLLRYGDNAEVLSVLSQRIRTGEYIGSEANLFDERLKWVRNWLQVKLPQPVQHWLQREQHHLESELAKAEYFRDEEW